MHSVRRWLVPFIVVASIGLVSGASTSSASDLPTGGPHFFEPDLTFPDPSSDPAYAGRYDLVTNRRPSNVAFLATGHGVSSAEDSRPGVTRVEDSPQATAGYDQGFLTQPEPGTTQSVRPIVQWPAADSEPETISTATGFLSSFESPDLVELRGDSGRWALPHDSPRSWTLTWYGSQKDGFQVGLPLDLSAIVGRPVGVQIVTGTTSSTSDNYILLATTTALYAYTRCIDQLSCGPSTGRFVLRARQSLPAGTRVLAIHHSPFAGLNAVENFADNGTDDLDSFAVLLSTPSVAVPGSFLLEVDFMRLAGVGSNPPFAQLRGGRWTATTFDTLGETLPSEPSGGDVRYAIGYSIGDGGVPSHYFVRIDMNVTFRFVGSRTYTAGRLDPNHNDSQRQLFIQPPGVDLNHIDGFEGCPQPTTGFDATYFNAVTDLGSGNFSQLEAHVSCVAPAPSGGVVVGGYRSKLNPGRLEAREVETQRTTVAGAAGTVAVRPQVAISLPCMEEIRQTVRAQHRATTDDFSWTNVNAQRADDRAYMDKFSVGDPAKRFNDVFTCSAGTMTPGKYPYERAGNEQMTVAMNVAPGGADALGSLRQATGATVATLGVVIPPAPVSYANSGAFPASGDPNTIYLARDVNTFYRWSGSAYVQVPDPSSQSATFRPEVTTVPVAAGTTLTRLPSTDVVERDRLTGNSKTCLTTATAAEKAACQPSLIYGVPVPIAVMAAPPYIQGTGQRGEITPEFGDSTTATQTDTRATSTSVGAELEIGFKGEFDVGVVKAEGEYSASVGYERRGEHSTSDSFTVTKANGYGGSFEDDTVVVNSVSYLSYEGVVVTSSNGLGLCDRPDTSSPCEPNPTRLSVPIGNIINSETVPDLQRTYPEWWGPTSILGKGLAETLTHVEGMPGTYKGRSNPDQEVDDYCDGALSPRQGFDEVAKDDPTPANPFTGTKEINRDAAQILTSDWRAGKAGEGITSQRANLEFESENGESFLEENSISASVSTERGFGNKAALGFAKVTLSAGGSLSKAFESSLGNGTFFSGTVGSIPDDFPDGSVADETLKKEQFEWRMFVCKRDLIPGVKIWVQNYEVRNYGGIFSPPVPAEGKPYEVERAEELGAVNDVAPVQSHLASVTPTFSWNQPEGSVKSYDLELEAVGSTDHRYEAGVRTYENFDSVETPAYHDADPTTDTYEDYAAASKRPEDLDYTLPATDELLPGQLYRWRVVSNNFFYKTSTSDWQYFVTAGPQTLSIGDASVVEGTSSSRSARFTVSLSAPVDHDVVFSYITPPITALPGLDYTFGSGRGTIAAGSTSTSISVPIRGDSTIEGDELFQVVLGQVTPIAWAKPFAFGRIIDDDPPHGAGIAIGDATVMEGTTGSRSLRFTVSRSSRKADPVTVTFTTQAGTATAGSDFTAVTGTVTIKGNETSAVIYVPVKGDAAREPDEAFTVRLTSPTGGSVFHPVGTGTIGNDD